MSLRHLPPFETTTLEEEEQFLAEHRARRPEIPKPLPVAMSPAFRAWERERTEWARELEIYEARVAMKSAPQTRQVKGTPWRGERMCS